MQLPEYITKDEVKRVCNELGFRDWTAITTPEVTSEEAQKLLDIVNVESMPIRTEDFRRGLEVELEHGTQFDDANITNNHPVLTGMIVLAHLKETLDYYQRIEVAEIEGDLLHAIRSRNMERIEAKYTKLIKAQAELNQAVSEQLK